MLEDLKERVCNANRSLLRHGLVLFTFGNVSGIDREEGLVVIKPSGVAYGDMKPSDMVVIGLEDGQVVDGALRPSSDTPTHLVLYREFEDTGGITHTHSTWATAWAQACRDVPCFGTTHADHFYGPVPCTQCLDEKAIEGEYEVETGRAVVRRFAELDPAQMPGVLVAQHGPFTWGEDPEKSVYNAVVLEEVAQTAALTMGIRADINQIPRALLDRHFLRKHGPDAYYGQK